MCWENVFRNVCGHEKIEPSCRVECAEKRAGQRCTNSEVVITTDRETLCPVCWEKQQMRRDAHERNVHAGPSLSDRPFVPQWPSAHFYDMAFLPYWQEVRYGQMASVGLLRPVSQREGQLDA